MRKQTALLKYVTDTPSMCGEEYPGFRIQQNDIVNNDTTAA